MKRMTFFLLGSWCLWVSHVLACTHFRLTGTDNTVVVGRSMEFAENLETDIYSINRGTKFSSKTPDGKAGFSWEAKYGYLALNGFHLFPVSGLNEQGLSFDALYLPGLAAYQRYDKNAAASSLPYYLIADYILGHFNNVDDVKAQLPKMLLYAKPISFENQSVVFPLHFVVTDKTGKGLVIEYINGELSMYDDNVGVLTNSPSYPWQVTNLNNYVNLSPYSPREIVHDGIRYNAVGQGAGTIGLPGDYSPPSRFVKTAYLTTTSKPTTNALKTVNLAAHILNNVDIPYGAVRGKKHTDDKADYTQWVVIKDLNHLLLYYRSYNDLSFRKIDIRSVSFLSDSPTHNLKLTNSSSDIIDETAIFLGRK